MNRIHSYEAPLRTQIYPFSPSTLPLADRCGFAADRTRHSPVISIAVGVASVAVDVVAIGATAVGVVSVAVDLVAIDVISPTVGVVSVAVDVVSVEVLRAAVAGARGGAFETLLQGGR